MWFYLVYRLERITLPPSWIHLLDTFNIICVTSSLLNYSFSTLNSIFTKVIYALSRLCAILKSNVGTLFVLALAASPTASKRPSNSSSETKETPRFAACEFPTLLGTSEQLTFFLSLNFYGLKSFSHKAEIIWNDLSFSFESIFHLLNHSFFYLTDWIRWKPH